MVTHSIVPDDEQYLQHPLYQRVLQQQQQDQHRLQQDQLLLQQQELSCSYPEWRQYMLQQQSGPGDSQPRDPGFGGDVPAGGTLYLNNTDTHNAPGPSSPLNNLWYNDFGLGPYLSPLVGNTDSSGRSSIGTSSPVITPKSVSLSPASVRASHMRRPLFDEEGRQSLPDNIDPAWLTRPTAANPRSSTTSSFSDAQNFSGSSGATSAMPSFSSDQTMILTPASQGSLPYSPLFQPTFQWQETRPADPSLAQTASSSPLAAAVDTATVSATLIDVTSGASSRTTASSSQAPRETHSAANPLKRAAEEEPSTEPLPLRSDAAKAITRKRKGKSINRRTVSSTSSRKSSNREKPCLWCQMQRTVCEHVRDGSLLQYEGHFAFGSFTGLFTDFTGDFVSDIIADVYAVETVSRFVQDHTERWTNETRIVTLTMDPLLDTVTVVLDYFRPRGQEARQQLQYHRQPDGTTVTSIEESCTLGLREVQNHHIESCEGLVNKILNQSCRSPKTFPRACYPLETRQHKFLRGLVRLLFKLHNQLSPKAKRDSGKEYVDAELIKMENQRSSLKESLRLVVTIFVQTQSILSVEEDSNGETKDVPIRVANRQLKTIILRMMTEAMSTNLHNLHQDIRLSDKTLGCLRSVVTLMCLGMGLEIIQRNIHLIRNAQTVATADLKPSFGYMHAKYLSRKTCLKLENKFDVLVRASAHKYKGIHLFDGNRRRGWAEKAGPKAAVFFGEVTDLMSDNYGLLREWSTIELQGNEPDVLQGRLVSKVLLCLQGT